MAASWLKRCLSIRLLGPVFRYDLVRSTRRGGPLFFRGLYAVFLLGAVLAGPVFWLMDADRPLSDIFAFRFQSADDMATFAASFFYGFLGLQWLLVLLVTPLYVAGVVTEEKERRTFEFLMTTDLRNREIVLGLLASRLAHLLLLLLTGLPVLCLLFFLGGVDATVLWAGFAAAAWTMIGLGAMSVLHSVYARRTWVALLRTYLTAFAYLVVTSLLWNLVASSPSLAGWPSAASPVTVAGVSGWLAAGNLPEVVKQIAGEVRLGKTVDSVVPGFLRRYFIFHMAAGIGCCVWAVLALRWRGRLEADGPRKKSVLVPRPAVGGWPLLWKEWFVEGGRRRGAIRRLGAGLILAALFFPVLRAVYFFGRITPGAPEDALGAWLGQWMFWLAGGCGAWMLVLVFVRAATGFAIERQRQTIDLLVLSPLTNREILVSKALGALFAGRWLWLWLAVAWFLAVVSGAWHPTTVAVWLGSWLLCAAFVAGVGLWFSLLPVPMMRAMFGALTTLAAAALMLFCVFDVLVAYALARLEKLGYLSPVQRLQSVEYVANEIFDVNTIDSREGLSALVVLILLVSADLAVFWLLGRRFRHLTGRAAGDLRGYLARGARWRCREVLVAWCTWGRRRLAAASLTLLPLGLLLACFAVTLAVAEKELRDATAAADRLDPGWRFDDLQASWEDIPASENAALQLKRVNDLFPGGNTRDNSWAWMSVEGLLAAPGYAPENQLESSQEEAALAGSLPLVQAARAAAVRLAEMPRGRYPFQWPVDGTPNMVVEMQMQRRVLALLNAEVLFQAQQEQPGPALTACRATLNAARAMGDELAFVIMPVDGTRSAAFLLERILAQTQPHHQDLAVTQALFEHEARQPLLRVGARGQRAILDRTLAAVHERGTGSLYLVGAGEPFVLTSVKHQRADVVDYFNTFVEATRLADDRRDQQIGQLQSGLPKRCKLVQFLGPFMLNMLESSKRNQGILRCAAAAAALERYRLHHQCWPQELANLIPDFLAAVPADPFDGQPIRYRLLNDGVVVYCLGPDMQDNGGKLDRRNAFVPGTDLGLRLWNVNRRRQPPAPPAPRRVGGGLGLPGR